LVDGLDGQPSDAAGRLLTALDDQAVGMSERLRISLDVVQAATGSGASIVVFEDLHWADPESVTLFERIADLPGARLLVGTYRPDELARRHPVADQLTGLERRHY